MNVSRHLPVYFSLQTNSDISTGSLSEQFLKLNYAWKKPSEHKQYKQLGKQNLKRVTHSSFTYDNVDVAYDTIISAMTSAAKISVSTRKVSKFLKPFWSPALGNFHKNLRMSRFAWIDDGKRRNGESYDRYKNSKRDFRRNLRTASSQYEQAELNKLNDLSETDQTASWKVLNSKKIKTRNKGCELLFNGVKENTIDGVLSSWKWYFEDLYAISEDKSFDDNVRDKVDRAVDS